MTYEQALAMLKSYRPNVVGDWCDLFDTAVEAIETVERLVEVVPNNTPYCYKPKGFDLEKGVMHVERCPFWKIRRDIEWNCNVEYCALLGKDLEVQDSVKDCGISCGL